MKKNKFTRDVPLPSSDGLFPNIKGRALKDAMKPKSAMIETSKIVDDVFLTKKANATGMGGRAIEDWGTANNIGMKGKNIGEYDASGKFYGESRDVSARKAVTKAADKAKKEQRRKEIYKKVDAKMATQKK